MRRRIGLFVPVLLAASMLTACAPAGVPAEADSAKLAVLDWSPRGDVAARGMPTALLEAWASVAAANGTVGRPPVPLFVGSGVSGMPDTGCELGILAAASDPSSVEIGWFESDPGDANAWRPLGVTSVTADQLQVSAFASTRCGQTSTSPEAPVEISLAAPGYEIMPGVGEDRSVDSVRKPGELVVSFAASSDTVAADMHALARNDLPLQLFTAPRAER